MKKILLFCFIALSAGTARSQWVNQTALLGYEGYMFDIEAPDVNTVWGTPFKVTSGVAAYTQDFLRTIDGGNTWTKGSIVGSPTGNNISNIWPIDADTCYVAMNKNTVAGGAIYKTTNGGANWSLVGSNMYVQTTSFPDVVYFFDAQHGIAVGDPAGPATPHQYEVYTTSDFGNTWTRVPSANLPSLANAAEYGITNLFNASQGHIWFGTTYGDLYHSGDMGMTWTKSATGLPVSLGTTRQDIDDIAFTDSLNGIVTQTDTSSVLHIRQTTDGGMTWSDVAYSGSVFAGDFDAVPNTNALVSVGSSALGFGSSFSIDNGATWVLIDTGFSHTAVDFVNNQVGWTSEYILAANTTGGAFIYAGAPLAVVTQFAASKETQIFPNPSNGTVHVIATSASRKTTFNVYDLQGKNVYSETVETLAMYNHELNLNRLTAGVYMLQITDGQNTSQHKLIIQ